MASPTPPLPTFLILGAQKSATRWLRINLGRHPDVYTVPTETMFFHSPERFEHRGLDWYREQFVGWSGESIVGEGTPGYMMWRHRPHLVARRIKEVVPDAQLIAILRNPVDRAQSAMEHFIRGGRLPPDSSLVEVVRRTPPQRDPRGLVSGGWYAASLSPYQELFGDQLLAILYDDVVSHPDRVYELALEHVGAAPGFKPADLEHVLFSSRRANDETSSEAAREERRLSDDERQELFAYFRQDVRALEKMLGRDLSMWDPGGSYTVDLTIDPWTTRSTERRRRRGVDVVRCYEQTADWIESLVLGASIDQYGLPTPCPRWTVRDLLNRMVWVPRLTAALLRDAAQPEIDDRDFIGEDAAAAYRDAADELVTAMKDPELLERAVESPFGTMHGGSFARFVFVDQLTHGWDLAAATDQDRTIPPSLLEPADRLARGVFAGMPRMPELFDVEVPVGDSAGPTERFVAYLGRDPDFGARTP